MKRYLVPLTSLLLVVALAACGSSGSQGTTQAPAETESSTQTTDDSKANDSEAKEDSTSKKDKEDSGSSNSKAEGESADDNASDEAQPVEEEETFERGTIDGDTYRNTLFGISFTLPEGYQFATDEQLAQMANLTADMLEDEASQKAIEDGRTIIDMYAIGTGGQNVSLTIEKVNPIAGVLADVEKYREICVGNLDQQLAGTGMEVVEHEDGTYQIGGTDYPSEQIVISYQGNTIYEQLVFLKSGSYFGLLTATGTSFEATEQMLSYCSEI